MSADEAKPVEETQPVAEEVESKKTKIENKNRKAFVKLGLKPLDGFKRVTLKKAKNVIFVIADPDVYQSGDTYIVIGEIKVEDQSAFAQKAAAAAQRLQKDMPPLESTKAASTPAQESAAEEEEETVDETGVEAKDIEVVMQQANVSRTKAVKALKNNTNDIVNAIMELTM